MKTYEPRRNNQCPNGLHADYNPDLDPSLNECTCPWLIIQSSTPVQHLTSWNRRELENAIREFDNGYFDPPGYPRRERSMFLSAPMQRLLDVAQANPVAAALTLLAGSGSGLPPFDAIAWDAEDAVLSLRIGTGGWWHLFLGSSNVEAVTNHDDAHAAGAAPVLLWADHPDTAAETGLAEGVVATPHEPAQDYFAEDTTGTALPIFAEVEALPRRVPQMPSGIAQASTSVRDAYEQQMFPPGDPRNDPSWKNCPSDLCAAQQSHWMGCPERSAEELVPRCAVPVRVIYPDDSISASTAYCEKAENHGDVHAGGGFAWSYDELEITAPDPR